MDRLIVYVDGFNLYHGLQRSSSVPLAVARPRRPCRETASQEPTGCPSLLQCAGLWAARRSCQAADILSSLGDEVSQQVQIIEGRYQKKPRRCRSCGVRWTDYVASHSYGPVHET